MISTDVDFSSLIGLKGFMNKYGDRIEKAMAATVQTNRLLLFMHDGAYNGHKPWLPPKYRDGQPLQDRGDLRNSIAPKSSNGDLVPRSPGKGGYIRYEGSASKRTVRVGTELIYAGIHDKGGRIVPKNAKALRFMIGKRVVFAKYVDIPKRNFTGWNEEDKSEMTVMLHNLLTELITEEINGG